MKLAGKIGDGHAAAMARLGLKELRNGVYPTREGVADSEIGLYGTMTQGEIAQARSGAGDGPEQESLTVDDLRKTAREGPEDGRSQGRDRGHGR